MPREHPFYYCVIFAGYVDSRALLPGVHLGQYGFFFQAPSIKLARKMQQCLEWHHKCRVGEPEIYSRVNKARPEMKKREFFLSSSRFPELFLEN